MNIGISTSVIQRGKTGIAGYVFALLRAFQPHSEGNRFTIFALEEDLPLLAFVREYMDVVTVSERYRAPIADIVWHQTVLPRLARHHELDVMHVPSYRRLCWRAPCALVGTVHDLAAFHVTNKYDWKRMFYGRVVAAKLAHRQDGLIAVSENTARDIAKFWKIAPELLTVIHHGIDRERFTAENRDAARLACHSRFDLAKPFFLYVARLEHPAKNHVPLIHAFERFKAETSSPWDLVFAGSDWHGAEQIHRAIESSPVRRDIRSLGFVRDAELPMLYRGAQVFVYPSLHEGFGFPPLEAMASGCPVLCSTRGALGEIVGDAALTVDPTDVIAMSTQLKQLASDESLRESLRQRGLSRAVQFDWDRAAKQTLAVYARAIERAAFRREGTDREIATQSSPSPAPALPKHLS
jgi:glycosyltransferase involved in cell wall biosynthesis